MLSRGGRVEVLQEDLEEFYATRLGNREGFGAYHTYSEAVAWMDDLHAQYPQVISARWSIGQGHLGNEIWCFRVSDNPETDEEGETEVLFDALHHAREVMSSEMVMMLAEHLGQQYAAGKPDIVTLLDANEIYMVPIVNPDGFLYNEQTNPNGGGMWRKNRRNNGDGTWGVDCNRNYSYEWGCSWGSSGDTDSDTYRGPAPASEPEVQAMIALVNSHDFVTRQSFHTSGELTLYPWGYTTDDTPDHTVFVEMASAMVQFNGYTAGQPGEVLYDVCGGNFDWDYGQQDEHTKIFAFTNEIGNSSDGFWPSDARRQDLFDDNLWPSLYMIQISASLRGVTFLHDPVPFSTDEAQDYAVTTVPQGFEGTAIDQGSVALHYRLDGGRSRRRRQHGIVGAGGSRGHHCAARKRPQRPRHFLLGHGPAPTWRDDRVQRRRQRQDDPLLAGLRPDRCRVRDLRLLEVVLQQRGERPQQRLVGRLSIQRRRAELESARAHHDLDQRLGRDDLQPLRLFCRCGPGAAEVRGQRRGLGLPRRGCCGRLPHRRHIPGTRKDTSCLPVPP